MKKMDTKRKKQLIAGILILAAFILASVAIFILAGRPIIQWVKDPEAFRAWVAERGWLGQLVFVGMMALQVIVAIIPGGPLEVAAGYAFGTAMGSVLCMLGIALGSSAVFWFVRKVGVRVVNLFFPREKIDELKFLQNERRRNLLLFLLFLVPGAPKDMLTYFSGLTRIHFGMWLLITLTARLPTVVFAALSGDALGVKKYQMAVAVIATTLIISAIGILVYRYMCKRENR